MTCLDKASAIVDGSGAIAYGHPRENLAKIAEFWSLILNTPVSPEQVALCMIGLKLGRIVTGSMGRDNLVDIAGYAMCIERLGEPRPDLATALREATAEAVAQAERVAKARGKRGAVKR